MADNNWFDIEPADAVNITLPADNIVGPLNEMGEPCPWPWEPQQLVGVPLGQYHCGYCGAMVIAGVPHPEVPQRSAMEDRTMSGLTEALTHRHDCDGGDKCVCSPAVLYDMGYEIWDALVCQYTDHENDPEHENWEGPTNAGIVGNVVTLDMKGKTWAITIEAVERDVSANAPSDRDHSGPSGIAHETDYLGDTVWPESDAR